MKMNKIIKAAIFTSAFLFLLAIFNSAQTTADTPETVPSNGSGEVSASAIDGMRSLIGNERLFVISRPGTGETKTRIAQYRLANAKSFMLESRNFNRQTSVFAEGEPVEGEGRIEFYIGNRLWLIILAQRNKIPKLTCCDDYFPPAKKKTKPKKRKS